jgi:hypothetical protein
LNQELAITPANATSHVMKQYQNQYQTETVDRFGEATRWLRETAPTARDRARAND